MKISFKTLINTDFFKQKRINQNTVLKFNFKNKLGDFIKHIAIANRDL